MNEPSNAYQRALAATQAHHAKKKGKTFSGGFLFKDQRGRVAELITRYKAKTILDYGCGWGKQYTDFRESADGRVMRRGDDWDFEQGQGRSLVDIFGGIDPAKYDPGVPHFSMEPTGKFDIVVCVQVLGCIPTADIPWVVDRLYGFAKKAVFVAERIGQPRKELHDHMKDEMPHGTTAEEWLEHLRRPGSPVRLFLATRNKAAEGKWIVTETEDQGK